MLQNERYNFEPDPALIEVFSLFSKRQPARVNMACLMRLATLIENEPSNSIPRDEAKSDLERTVISRFPKAAEGAEGEEDDEEDEEDKGGGERGSSVQRSAKVINRFLDARLLRTSIELDDRGRDVSYLHMTGLCRDLLDFLQKTAAAEKPSVNIREISAMYENMESIDSRRSQNPYDSLVSVYSHLRRELDNLEAFADEFNDFVRGYEVVMKDLAAGSEWIDSIFGSEYFTQYIFLCNSGEYRYAQSIRRIKKLAGKFLTEPELFDWIVESEFSEMQNVRLMDTNSSVKASHQACRDEVGGMLRFLYDEALKQFNRKSKRVRQEVQNLISRLNSFIEACTRSGLRSNVVTNARTLYEYMKQGGYVSGVTELYSLKTVDIYSLKERNSATSQVSVSHEILPVENTEEAESMEDEYLKANRLVEKALSGRPSCHIREILPEEDADDRLHWDKAAAVNHILYNGSFGPGDRDLTGGGDVSIDYVLERSGEGPVVPSVEDGEYRLPDIIIHKE